MFLLEAMANGVPVVQPRRGAFPEIVETTGGGLLVEPDNPEALADGLLDALARIRRGRAALGRAGAEGVRRALHRRTHGGVASSAVYAELAGDAQEHHVLLSCEQRLEDLSDAARRAARPDRTCRSTSNRGEAAAIMGPSGQRQEHAALHSRRARAADVRHGHARRAGSVQLGERAQAAFRNRRIGFVFQDHSLLPQCSVLENVLAPTLVRRPTSATRDGRRARARAADAGRPRRSPGPPARRAVGRREAAGRDRAGADPRAAAAAVRRADRQSRSRRRPTPSPPAARLHAAPATPF